MKPTGQTSSSTRGASAGRYLLLDAARMADQFETAKAFETSSVCLYNEKDEASLATVAPYLFSFDPQTEFGRWYYNEGWGNSWGYIIHSSLPMNDLKKHLEKFLVKKLPGGMEEYFRFYDPRVLKKFLPTYEPVKLIEFFGPVEKFIVEGDTKEEAIEFTHDNGLLITKKIKASDVFGEIKMVEIKDESTVNNEQSVNS